MVWFGRIAVAWVFFMIGAVALIGYLARTQHYPAFTVSSDDGRYQFNAFYELPVPKVLGGPGGGAGGVEVLDREGRRIDSEEIQNVRSVRDIRWERFRVDFTYTRYGQSYESYLELPQ